MKYSQIKSGQGYLYLDKGIWPGVTRVEIEGDLTSGLLIAPTSKTGSGTIGIGTMPNGTRTISLRRNRRGQVPQRPTVKMIELAWSVPPKGTEVAILAPCPWKDEYFQAEVRHVAASAPSGVPPASASVVKPDGVVSIVALAKVSKLLPEIYDDSKMAYAKGNSDGTLAKTTGYSESVIRNIREALYGVEPDHEGDALQVEFDELKLKFVALQNRLDKYLGGKL